MSTLICDIETYHGFFLVAFKRAEDGKIRTFELSDRSTINRDVLRSILKQNRIVTFNGMTYDMPLIWYYLEGADNAALKLASDRIINGNVRYWEVEQLLGIQIPRLDHIDLIEPQPNAFASLKTLNGRLHGPRMQDLPIAPDARLTHADMDLLTSYCINDLDATHRLFDALAEPLALREALSKEYRQNFMSKSDSQIGEQIVKRRVEDMTKEKVQRVETPAGTSFRYKVPVYMQFETAELKALLERLHSTEFFVQDNGKVDLPAWLSSKSLMIGTTTYAVGIGGLHSTESNRAVYSDEDNLLIDWDVLSFYPAIILGSGLYPKSLGPEFLEIYSRIRDERIAAKEQSSDKTRSNHDRLVAKTKAEGGKIQLNGVFGKLGSPYSVLYAPYLLIAVTLTGQLSILMLIERAEAAGIPCVSANTDGVVFRCPRDRIDELNRITKQWETETGFVLESTPYKALYSASVNTYIAVKEDGKVKRKGTVANPRADDDMRGQLMKNPNAVVCSDAVVALIAKGTPIEDYIRQCSDVRDFVTVVNVKGGATWRGEYLGKVVRYYWATDGEEILYKIPHPSTGNFKRVAKTEACRPLMELPEGNALPPDIDYARYIHEAEEILKDVGMVERPPDVKPLRVFKYNATLGFAFAV